MKINLAIQTVLFEQIENFSINTFAILSLILLIVSFLINYVNCKIREEKFDTIFFVRDFLILVCINFILHITLLNRKIEGARAIELIPLQKIIFASNAIKLKELLYILFNIILFIPLGIMLSIQKKQYSNLRIFICILSLCFNLSLIIELTQLTFRLGYFQVDDLIFNTFGGCVGYMFFILAQYLFHLRRDVNDEK